MNKQLFWNRLYECNNFQSFLNRHVKHTQPEKFNSSKFQINSNIPNLKYMVRLQSNSFTVEILLDHWNPKTENESKLRTLQDFQTEIENRCGELEWVNISEKINCKIIKRINCSNLNNEGRWPQIFDEIVCEIENLEESVNNHRDLLLEINS